MIITRISPFSGNVNTFKLPITLKQMLNWQNGTAIQKAMPNLTPDQREFIMTGITPTEWEESFGK